MYGRDEGPFVVNGVFIEAPDDLVAGFEEGPDDDHREWAAEGVNSARPERRYTMHPEPGGLLYFGSTEGRDTLCWDTLDPDPDRWPVVNLGYGEVNESWPLAELLVAELTGVGMDLTAVSLGDPAEWAWPFWGPRPPRA
jgi:hypothetical protein